MAGSKLTEENRGRWNWPPEMEAEYQRWANERENPCQCLTCLNIRLKKVRAALATQQKDGDQ